MFEYDLKALSMQKKKLKALDNGDEGRMSMRVRYFSQIVCIVFIAADDGHNTVSLI
jgi:hypothetical protein